MKTAFNLLLALAIIVIFGGTAFFLVNISKGTTFERNPVTPVVPEPAETPPAENPNPEQPES